MLRLAIILFIGLNSVTALAQSVVEWEFSYDPTENVVVGHATIDEGWHLYSQFVDEFAGPVPTSFDFEENGDLLLIGTPQEPKAIAEYDENFESEVLYFKDEVNFKQQLEAKSDTELSGTVTFMVCNATMCLPPEDESFVISIKK